MFNELHEECGVFGIYGCAQPDAARAIYYGLFALQHRGQESCGMAVSDKGIVTYHKDMGLVRDVFGEDKLSSLIGEMGIGHVRYSTTGGSIPINAQPLVLQFFDGTIAIAHNGNLTNTEQLRRELEGKGAIFQTTTDSEIIACIIARERLNSNSLEEAVKSAMNKIEGAYSLLVMGHNKIIAARDPYGFKPLCIGKCDSYVFASETCALDSVGAKHIRDIEPGEIVVIDENGLHSIKDNCAAKKASHCIFEYIYFARPDSVIDGVSVHQSRLEAGKILAKQHPVEADIVIGVPDSGIDAALGYSQESGIPYGRGFVKNNYVGRTFISPTQDLRVRGVKIKLNVLGESVKGKRVVMLDDSIVRGTTSAGIVTMLKEAGATEVHVRISSPPFLWPCYFGTDIPSQNELAAFLYTQDEIRQQLGANSLGYLSVDALKLMLGNNDISFCDACFTGNYAVVPPNVNLK